MIALCFLCVSRATDDLRRYVLRAQSRDAGPLTHPAQSSQTADTKVQSSSRIERRAPAREGLYLAAPGCTLDTGNPDSPRIENTVQAPKWLGQAQNARTIRDWVVSSPCGDD